jgi:hypothetical protein
MATLNLQAVNTIEQAYLNKTADILREKQRKPARYIGEGLTFLAIISIGAAYVYRATRRQIKLA